MRRMLRRAGKGGRAVSTAVCVTCGPGVPMIESAMGVDATAAVSRDSVARAGAAPRVPAGQHVEPARIPFVSQQACES